MGVPPGAPGLAQALVQALGAGMLLREVTVPLATAGHRLPDDIDDWSPETADPTALEPGQPLF